MVTDLEHMYPQPAVRITGHEVIARTAKGGVLIWIDGKSYWLPESAFLDETPDYIDIPKSLAIEKEMI